MGEESPALPSDGSTVATISHRRLLIEMAMLIALGSIAGFVFGGTRFGFGVLFGGLLAFLNYYWLKRSTAAIFEKAFAGSTGRFVSLRFIGRYVVLGLVLLAIYFSGAVPVTAVIAGLSAFAIAVVVDGFISIFRRNI
jgi:hypothetical protein